MTIGFIGAGKVAQALARGFINAGKIEPAQIIASSPPADIAFLKQIAELGVQTTHENLEVVHKSKVTIVAIKPPLVPKILTDVCPAVTEKNLFISVAMGITLQTLEQVLPPKTRVIRVMPNTPCLVQEGASVFSLGSYVMEGDSSLVKNLLSSVGLCEEVPENLIDAVTGLSGSGPAYAFAAIEALSDGGVKMGIPRDLSIKLAAQTLLGAAKMVLQTGKHPEALKDDVCSPGGTTIHGMHKLEEHGFRAALINAVEAATLQAKFMGTK